ncbi:ENDOU [Bugula neritina]|uniref:Uridylate-specific endoribonuclease n=1 Tax=Bugula neritina TaxID=10212 RepID=A0A7J7KGE2_BUGNE|nr:ENDOU [Bugula neritina]
MKINSVLFSVMLMLCWAITIQAESCVGRCGGNFSPSQPCQCNDACMRVGDCCSDYQAVCLRESCTGRCGDDFSTAHTCQCNSHCQRYDDCCEDYDITCESGSGEENEITDTELLGIGNTLWESDHLRYTDSEIAINADGDELFSYVDERKLSQPSYALFIALLNNYNPLNDQREPNLTSAELAETEAFLNHVASSQVMSHVNNLLESRGKIQRGALKDVLYDLWFTFYGRRSSMTFADSSGFEHVFVGEKKSDKINGFHSWVQMYLLQKSGNLDYLGYNAKSEPSLIDTKFNWDGLYKARGSMFIGTSPEFDMALYTLCMLARPGQQCNTQIQDNIVSIQTYDVSHVSGIQVATAFPMVSNGK